MTSLRVSTLNTIIISQSRLLENYSFLKNIDPKIAIAPVLKSNAYGHGIEQIGPLLTDPEIPFFCVYSLEEAETLRQSGVSADILIMGGIDPKVIKQKKLDFTFAAFDRDYIALLNEYQPGASIHLYLDSGLHREGVPFGEFEKVLSLVKDSTLSVTGLMSHFACSNDPYCDLTKRQIEDFKKAKQMVLDAGLSPRWFHFGGALALINSVTDECNVIRCGKALFGIGLKNAPSAEIREPEEVKHRITHFKPTLQLSTRLIQIKHVKKDEFIGYVETFQAKQDMTIGIIPIGYFDGVDRRLSNTGYMTLSGVLCPIVGMVSMNATIIDISGVSDPKIDDEVIVYSWNAGDKNSLDSAAVFSKTIPQDLLVHLQSSLSRIVIE